MTDNKDGYAESAAWDELAYSQGDEQAVGSTYVEEFIAANRIVQITPLPAVTIGDVDFAPSYRIAIGNNIYDGPTIADCVAQSVGRV
jgi:hypothetical protein